MSHVFSFGTVPKNCVDQLLERLEVDTAPSRLPQTLVDAATPAISILHEVIGAWTRLAQDCRSAFRCLALPETKILEAYVLVEDVKRRQEATDADELNLPESKFWADSPFFRLGQAMCRAKTLLGQAMPHIEVHVAVAAAAAQTTHGMVSSQRTPKELVTAIQTTIKYDDTLKPKVIPCRPIFYDLSGAELAAPDISHYCTSPSAKEGFVGRLAALWGRR